MIAGIRTMVWKEWKETLLQSNLTRTERRARAAIVAVILSILVWKAGPLMATTPTAFVMPSFILLFLLASNVADSFAGERDRHTLETLLASPLPDGVILIGKLLASVLLVWGIVLFGVAMGIVSARVMNRGTSLILFPLNRAIPILCFYFLLTLAIGTTGILVSLRASTVRQAMQILNIALIVVSFGLLYAFQMLPDEWRKTLARAFAEKNLGRTELTGALVLIVINLVLFTAASLRFRRSRLLLD